MRTAGSDGFGIWDWLRLAAAVGWLVIFVFTPRVTLAVTLVVIGGTFIAFNGMVFWVTMVRQGHGPAVAPVFGGIIAAGGIVVLPVDGVWKWAWIPLALDWGGPPMFIVWGVRRTKT